MGTAHVGVAVSDCQHFCSRGTGLHSQPNLRLVASLDVPSPPTPPPQVHSRILSSTAVIPFRIFSPPVIMLLSYGCTQPLCTAERHSSGLTGTARHPDMQKIRIIGFLFENRLYWQFEFRLFLVTVCTVCTFSYSMYSVYL